MTTRAKAGRRDAAERIYYWLCSLPENTTMQELRPRLLRRIRAAVAAERKGRKKP
jgi:hypothetical protein